MVLCNYPFKLILIELMVMYELRTLILPCNDNIAKQNIKWQ